MTINAAPTTAVAFVSQCVRIPLTSQTPREPGWRVDWIDGGHRHSTGGLTGEFAVMQADRIVEQVKARDEWTAAPLLGLRPKEGPAHHAGLEEQERGR
jgi:hypothetical protein